MTRKPLLRFCRRNLLRLFWLASLIPAVLFSVKCGSWDLQVSWSEASAAISGNSSEIKILMIRHLLLPRSLGAVALGVILGILARKPQLSGSRGNWLIFDASAWASAVMWLLTSAGFHTGTTLMLTLPAVWGYLKLLKKLPFFFSGTILLVLIGGTVPSGNGKTLFSTLSGDLFWCQSEVLTFAVLLILAAMLADRLRKIAFLSDCTLTLNITAAALLAGAVPGISILSRSKNFPPWWTSAVTLLFFDTILRQFSHAPGAGLLLLLAGCASSIWEIRQKKIRTSSTDAE